MNTFTNLLIKFRWYLRSKSLKKKGITSPRSRKSDLEYETKLNNLVIEDIKKYLKLKPTDILVDVGCADGHFISKLHQYVSKTIGIDYSKAFIQLANDRFGNNKINFKFGNLLNIPLKSESCDKVYCYSVIQYINARKITQALKELKRIVKKNGIILLGDIYDYDKKNIFKNEMLKDYSKSIPDRLNYFRDWFFLTLFNPVSFYSKKDLIKLANSLDLDIQIYPQNPSYPYSKLCYDAVLIKNKSLSIIQQNNNL